MKNLLMVPSIRFLLVLMISLSHYLTYAQNVGLGLLTPVAKLHIKGSADVSQLIIEANAPQTNINPLIRFRKSTGTDLMWLHSDDSTNVFLGLKAGSMNVIGPQGIRNSFIGSHAGYSNTNGRDNTAVGSNALYSNTKGSWNTAIGTNALFSQSFTNNSAWYQSKNVAVGYEALYSNQPTNTNNGMNNTAIGTSSLFANTTGAQNTACGTYALFLNTLGSGNTANGYEALNSNTTALNNTAIGALALFSQSYSNNGVPWATDNVAVGYQALYATQPVSDVQGEKNTGVGNYALSANTSGNANTAIGFSALYLATGTLNTAIGSYAISGATTGGGHSAFGYHALETAATGSWNTCLGGFSDISIGTLSGSTAIGVDATVNASNKIRFGDGNITVIEGQVAYSWPSDGRFKENIQNDVLGLDFIMKLKPVSFNFNRLKYAQHVRQHLTPEIEQSLVEKSQIRSVGFIAQDVEKIIQQTGFTSFDALHAPTNETDNYSLGYAEFVVPLVKAVQELSQKNQSLIEKNDEQDLLIVNLLQRIERLEASMDSKIK